MALLHLLHLEFPSTKFQYMKSATSAVCKFMKGCTLLTLWRDNMISKLMKVTFVGCIVIAASVPAEAGLFDRILNRNGGRKASCCQPQVASAPAPCALKPCAPTSCVAAPCQTPPTCLQTYHRNLELCNQHFGNDPQKCAECQTRAALAYCECIQDAGTKRFSDGARRLDAYKVICPIPADPICDDCDTMYNDCIRLGGANCNTCWFACLNVCTSLAPPPPLTFPNQ